MTLAAIAPLLATLALWAPGLNIPERVTFGPEEEYMPSISPDGQLLAFVSNRDNSPNIWVISLEGARFSTPLRLTSVSSGGKGPAFSPDGKSVAYVSYGADAEGDIHRVSLPDKYGHGPEPEPITGFDTADREPAFFPDGKRILFTSISKTGAGDGLTIVDTGGKQATRLIAGGRSAAISPSGSRIAFIAPGEKGPSALHLASAEGGPAMALASGEYIDASPVFASEDQIIFVRYIDDTNLDGALTFDDRPALYRLDLASPASPPAPLTTTESFNLFPAVHGGVIYYTIQEGKSVDIYRLAMAGVVPTTGSLEGDMRQAEQVERFYTDRPALALLAWRAAWAVNHDDPDKASLAECLIHQAQLLERGGAFPSAQAALTRLMELYPGQGPQVAQAAVTLTRIEGQRLGRPAEWIVQQQTAHMERYANIPRPAAMARLERGRAFLRQGRPELALEDFRGVMGGLQATLPDLAAEAAFLRNEVYSLFGAEDKRLLVYLEVVEKFPEQAKWRDMALERIIELSMAPGDLKASILNLSALAEKYAHLPYVRATAMEKQAQLYLQANETAMASQIYSHMARIFAGGPQAGAALLGLG
ncbi:MAG: hypothetical protein OEV92_13170, partial [Nitrospinota bacterium]|nr:hypothetical protein [Nitrospinota bacterium]